MVLTRRGFLSALIPAAIVLTDPELIGWTKTKSIFIPPPLKIKEYSFAPRSWFQIGDKVTFAGNPRVFTVTDVADNGGFSFVPDYGWAIETISKAEFKRRYPDGNS